ncbi:response regulator [Piscinibacter gummiphilus]|uniref:DNA-binding response regulator n=1 Tax=Piscinibacter gummiphilus TaxID=946333 RepID=A0A1W6L5L0_9BURK|nr:response regulator [Piscinibacter gummiphilus]ARN19609.1 DNA-binding response regulator [Piscinibacter gummiphilus]ATU64278.1 DNA-binding response regulator [Piscinibacter gummiphilus]GLS93477.1 DNA-binding response regulator [Piscinibacter gummiphilus]
MKILIVEDEPELAQAVAAAFRRDNAVVDCAESRLVAEHLVLSGSHDVVVLDRGLPDGDGLKLIEFMRDAGLAAPVLVLTAMGEVAERVKSLDCGADDYLAKPFSMDELTARVRALTRRPSLRSANVSTLGRLRYDHDRREATCGEALLVLTRRELLVLDTLLLHRGRTVLRDTLQQGVYGDAEDIRSNSLDAHVSRLRSKLQEADAQVEIHAIRGVGYLIKATVAA